MAVITKLPAPVLNPEDPWAGDQFDRQQLAERLSAVLSTADQNLTLGIDGKYGSGKTFFVQRWKHQLLGQGYQVVYLDAWSTDFTGDPLAAFIAALSTQLPTPAGKSITKSVNALARAASPLLVKAAVRRVLGDETVKEFMDVAGSKDEIAEAIGAAAKKRIDAQKEAEKAVEGFKKQLTEIADKFRKDDAGPGLIVIVDELDRCRPTYALEMLEHIKHFFSVQGVVFVMSLDRAQLESAVKARYGAEFDADGYLRRFFDWWVRLPAANNHRYAEYLITRFNLVADGLLASDNTYDKGASILATNFAEIADQLQISLRAQEQIFIDINASLRSLNKGKIPGLAFYLPIIAVAYHFIPNECRRYCKRYWPPKPFLDWVKKYAGRITFSRQYDITISMLAIYLTADDAEPENLTRLITDDVSSTQLKRAAELRVSLIRTYGMYGPRDMTFAGRIYDEIEFWARARG